MVCSSSAPTRLIGLMMGIDMVVRRGCRAIFCAFAGFFGLLGGVYAQPSAELGLWVVDGLRAGHIIALDASDKSLRARWLRLYRLTEPVSSGLECCLQLREPTTHRNDARDTDKTSLLLAMRNADAHQPFVGIALADGDAKVRRTGPQTIQVRSKNSSWAILVRHCATQEGVRIDVEQGNSSRTYYIPLGMDVDAPKKYRCVTRS